MPREVPYQNFNFRVVDDTGGAFGGFSDVSGLAAEIMIAEYRAGNDPQNHVSKIAGMHKFENVTLKRGVIDSTMFFEWMEQTWHSGPGARRNIRIILQNEEHTPVQQWTLRNAVPTKYTAPTLAAQGGESAVAVEEISLAYEDMKAEQLSTD
jgi:phage tail-like protein